MGYTHICILLLAFLLIAPSFGRKLKLVILHHRHGARNTFYNFGTKPTETGQLTAVGLRQLYILGREFRKRYVDELNFVPGEYTFDQVYSRSTQINRTLQSAQAFWSGFYHNGTGPKFKPKYPMERAVPPIGSDFNVSSLSLYALPGGVQPVPVHSCDLKKDWVLQAYDAAACPNMKKVLDNPTNKKISKELEATFKPTFQEVAAAMKLKNGAELTLPLMSSIADYLYSNYMSNIPTEIAPDSELWERFMMTKNISILLGFYPTRLDMNIFTTKLYEDMLYRMDAALTGKSKNRLIEFSSHDLTLNLILISLNITSWECLYAKYKNNNFTADPTCAYTTDVAASITFELWQEDDNSISVTLLYNGVPYPINGKNPIPYDEFTAILRSTLVPNFFDYCLGTDTVEESMPVWQIVVVAIQALAVVVLAWLFIRKRMEVSQALAEKGALSYE